MKSERKRQTDRDWQYRKYHTDEAFRERRLARWREWFEAKSADLRVEKRDDGTEMIRRYQSEWLSRQRKRYMRDLRARIDAAPARVAQAELELNELLAGIARAAKADEGNAA